MPSPAVSVSDSDLPPGKLPMLYITAPCSSSTSALQQSPDSLSLRPLCLAPPCSSTAIELQHSRDFLSLSLFSLPCSSSTITMQHCPHSFSLFTMLPSKTLITTATKEGMEGDNGLCLSLSLSPPGGPSWPMAKAKKLAGRSNPSCELTLSTPSCRYNAEPHSLSPPPPPEETVESLEDSTFSLERTLSPPFVESPRAATTSTKEESGSSSTTHSNKEVVVELGNESGDANPPPSGEKILSNKGSESRQQEEMESRKRKSPEKDVEEGTEGDTATAEAEGLLHPMPTWREKAQNIKGTSPTRVLVKTLFPTDVSPGHARLLLTDGNEDKGKRREKGTPPRQKGPTKLLAWLTSDERAAVSGPDGLRVLLLDRWGREYPGAKLKHWQSSDSYNILGNWIDFVRLNELDPGDTIEVHVFRVPMEMQAPAQPAAAPQAPAAETLAAQPPQPPSTASIPTEDLGGPRPQELRVALVLCSQVPVEEEERRRRQSLESVNTRREQKVNAMKRRRTKNRRDERAPRTED